MRSNKRSPENIAKSLAKSNFQSGPGIQKIYWFKNDKEIRLLEIDSEVAPFLSYGCHKLSPFISFQKLVDIYHSFNCRF